MKITKTNTILLFVELGFANATNWDTAKLTTKINQIADKVDVDHDMKTDEGTKLLKQVFEASESGEKIEVTEEAPKSKKADKTPAKAEKPAKKGKPAPADEDEEEAEDEEEVDEEETPAPKGKSKKPAPAPEADEDEDDEKPAKKAKSEGKDRFGNRVNSQAGQINAAMSKKLQTVDQIAEATGLSEARVRSHMQYLIGKKLAEHVEDKGYRLIK